MAGNIEQTHAINGMSQPRPTPQRKDIFLIESADHYKIVMIGKRNFWEHGLWPPDMLSADPWQQVSNPLGAQQQAYVPTACFGKVSVTVVPRLTSLSILAEPP